MIPGELVTAPGTIALRAGRARATIVVRNTGDRPIQVGSHAHVAEVNGALEFDRALAHGMCLDIPAGTAVRFEPGIERPVGLVAFGGERCAPDVQRTAAGRRSDAPPAAGAPETAP